MVKYNRTKISTETCPKCGASMDLHKVYHTPSYESKEPEDKPLDCMEHMEVMCGNCCYSTQYLTLDSKEEPQDGV